MRIGRDTGYLRRHLDGWQAALVAVTIVLLAAILVVPRAGARVDLPLPDVDREAQLAELERLDGLAGRAKGHPLPYAVRAVGEQVRRIGAMSKPSVGAQDSIVELRRLVRAARTEYGNDPLLVLRAVQTRLFIRAVDRWLSSRAADRELTELAGNFPEVAQSRGWVDDARLTVAREDLESAYLTRWTVLAGLADDSTFAPSLDDLRVYFRLRIGYPEIGSGRENLRELSDDIVSLFKKDSEYPIWLARGVVDYHAHRYEDAAGAFRQHLTLHPSGPWTLRARNYLAEAVHSAPPAL